MRTALALIILFSAPLAGQVRVVKEIGSSPYSSVPRSLSRVPNGTDLPRFSRVGKWTYFAAWTPGVGQALHRTDGTTSGTQFVADVTVGTYPTEGPVSPSVLGSKLFFQDLRSGGLHVTDSLTNKTTTLRTGFLTDRSVAFQGKIWFGDQGVPWSSDGTPAGTQAASIGAVGNFVPRVVFGNELYFTGNSGTQYGLFRTNGTPAGTMFVGALNFAHPTIANGLLFFIHNQELWRTDGTTAGTSGVTRYPSMGIPVHTTTAQGGIYFTAWTKAQGTELHWSDGKVVKSFDLYPGSGSSNPYNLIRMGKGVAFVAKHPLYGYEPCLFDGTSFVIRDLDPAGDSAPASLLLHGSKVLAGAQNGLFEIDRISTRKVHGVAGANYLTATANGVLFAGGGSEGTELWTTDATTTGTKPVKDIASGRDPKDSGYARYPVSAGDRVYFLAGKDLTQQWRTDGTSAGSVRIGSRPPVPYPWHYFDRHDSLFWNGMLFGGNGGSADRRTYVFDTRTLVTRELGYLGGTITAAERPRLYRNAIYFVATHKSERKLFRTDGVSVQMIRSLGGITGREFGTMVVYRDRLHFPGADRMWASDGTAPGTVPVLPTTIGAPRHLTVVGNRLVFITLIGNVADLFFSDGTLAGTSGLGLRPTGPFGPGRYLLESVQQDYRSGFAHVNGRVLFVANSALNSPNNTYSGISVWSTDGTIPGTSWLSSSSGYPLIAAAGDSAYFSALGAIYRTDGTKTGTQKHIQAVATSPMKTIGDRVFFVHRNSGNVAKIMSTDGTKVVEWDTGDVQPIEVDPLAVMRGELYFIGISKKHGQELFALPIGAYAATVIPGCGHLSPPQLDHTRPIAGQSVTVRVRNVPANKIGFYLTGFAASSWQQLGGYCQTVLDLTKPILLVGFRPNSTGSWSLRFPLPNDPSMIGIIHPGQAVVGPTTTAPFGMDWSNGLHFHMDRR